VTLVILERLINDQNVYYMVDAECLDWPGYLGCARNDWPGTVAVDKVSGICYNVFTNRCGAVGRLGCGVLKDLYDQ
jgi:hypothetical protein